MECGTCLRLNVQTGENMSTLSLGVVETKFSFFFSETDRKERRKTSRELWQLRKVEGMMITTRTDTNTLEGARLEQKVDCEFHNV